MKRAAHIFVKALFFMIKV